MKTIFRYRTNDENAALLPEGAEVQHVEPSSKGGLNVWAIVDPDAPKVKSYFEIIPTGAWLPEVGTIKVAMKVGMPGHPKGFLIQMDGEAWHEHQLAALEDDVAEATNEKPEAE